MVTTHRRNTPWSSLSHITEIQSFRSRLGSLALSLEEGPRRLRSNPQNSNFPGAIGGSKVLAHM